MSMSFLEAFSVLRDPRVHHNKVRHKLLDVVMMTVCAVTAGAEDWIDVVDFATAKRSWFEEFLELPGGIPSHDTFARLFAMIDPEAFGSCFMTWVSATAKRKNGRIVAVDGKTVRRSHDGNPDEALHMVSAFCADQRLVLGQLATEDKSNEITAIPKLLGVLDIRKAIVTIDAMGAQKEIVTTIRDRKADYVIGLKANQPKLHSAVVDCFSGVTLDTESSGDLDVHVIDEKGHGRRRTQGTFVTTDLSDLPTAGDWTDLRSVAMVITEFVNSKGQLTTEKRYYLSSLGQDATKLAHAIRSHWSIENSLHWVLDVVFDEDHSRTRRDNGAANLAVIRHAALNLIRQDKSTKASVKSKRNKAAWDLDYLTRLLFGD
jgi:predicted transposase YbfD/YdcC